MYKFDKGLLVLNNDKKSELFDIIQSDIHDKGAERFVPFLSSKSHHRSHANSVKIANGKASPANFEYFANSLKIVGKDDPAFKHPKDRVALGGHVILTIEFDGATDADGADLTREFFDFQIGWFRANKKPSDSIFGQFLTGLRQRYYDLIGATVVYSGHKSFHFHFLFKTDLLKNFVSEASEIRAGYIAAWDRLAEDFTNSLVANSGFIAVPDRALRTPDQLRRVPNGLRSAGRDHFLGVPEGVDVRQSVVFEHLTGRAIAPEPTSIFRVEDFTQSARLVARKIAAPLVTSLTDAQEARLKARLHQYFPTGSYPELVSITARNGRFEARFRNSTSDANASSVMAHDRRTVLALGKGATISGKALPKPLGEFCAEVLAQSDIEYLFERRVKSKGRATTVMGAVMSRVLQPTGKGAGNYWIVAPEGISKSRSLFAAIIRKRQGGVMFAFSAYDTAREKCEEFRALAGDQFNILFVESATRVYQNFCAANGVTPITDAQLIGCGAINRFDGIRKVQPEAHRAILDHFDNQKIELASGKPLIIFTVHAVAQSWTNSQARKLLGEPSIETLIHDEISVDDLLLVANADDKKVAEKYENHGDYRNDLPLAARLKLFHGVRLSNSSKLTFERAEALVRAKGVWQSVQSKNNCEYDARENGRDIYNEPANQTWFVQDREWLNDFAKIIVLTTEIKPTLVARNRLDFNFLEFTSANLIRDRVPTTTIDRLTSRNFADIALEEISKNQNLMVITNKAADVDGVWTHAKAKGSNAFIGHDVLQIVGLMAPEQYAVCEMLNALCGRADMVLTTHVDEMNQSFGRNLGFRSDGQSTHRLIINHQLYQRLERSRSLVFLRYALSPIVNEQGRKNIQQKNRRRK